MGYGSCGSTGSSLSPWTRNAKPDEMCQVSDGEKACDQAAVSVLMSYSEGNEVGLPVCAGHRPQFRQGHSGWIRSSQT
jgi:hypothetical protein